MRKLERLGHNRAATAFFRVFGGRAGVPAGDATRLAAGNGHHRGEWRVLALLVPLMTGAALFDALGRIGGGRLAGWGMLPLLLPALHLLAIFLGGSRPEAQWRRWKLALTLWALWRTGWGGGPNAAVWLWLGVLALDAAGALCLLWRGLMEAPQLCTTAVRWAIALGVQLPSVLIGWRHGWEWALASQVPLAALWACGTFLPNARIFGPVARRVKGEGVLLTIDDGPDPVDTPALLDLLDRHGRKAVFFVIGDKVRRYPDLAREIVRRGHELGNHTMTHPAGSMWCAGSARTRREIVECSRAIEEVAGVRPRWFRAPAGHRNWFTHPVLREEGLELVGWTRRGYDTVRTDVPGIVKRLTVDARDGDILLLHEATPIAKEVMEGVLGEGGWEIADG
jgi:peptidoglycan/xylan/chitin deacetylase (PgdA/CDA1 family)